MAFSEDDRRKGLVNLRQRLRVSGLEVASAAKISNSRLSTWERGYTELPEGVVDLIENFLTDELAELKAFQPAAAK
jgi:transcriptional regulator with XRE-family HTH domain